MPPVVRRIDPLAAGIPRPEGRGHAALPIQAARHHFGLIQLALSQKTGIPQRHLSEMKNGKRSIGKKTAKPLAKTLKLDYRSGRVFSLKRRPVVFFYNTEAGGSDGKDVDIYGVFEEIRGKKMEGLYCTGEHFGWWRPPPFAGRG